MEEGRILFDLAKGLSEEERKRLLEKIKNSVQITGEEDIESFKAQEPEEEEKEREFKKELEELGIFQRILVWIITRLSGKTEKEVFLGKKIKSIKRMILRENSNLIPRESRRISSKIAEELFKLYTNTLPVKKAFYKVWTEIDYFERGILKVFEKEIPNPKITLTDLISSEELQELYIQTTSKSAIKEETNKRIDIFITSIPESIIKKIEEGILPLFLIKEIVLFPYQSLFRFFQLSTSEDMKDNKPQFKDASSFTVINYLKKYEAAMLSSLSVKSPIVLQDDFITYAIELMEEDLSLEKLGQKKERLLRDIAELMQKTVLFYKNVPLKHIIQYYLQDPYYSTKPRKIEIDLKEFYSSLLKIKYAYEIEEGFPGIQKRYIEEKIKTIFGERPLKGFLNYREYASIDYIKLGVPFFIHTKSLNLIFNFINLYYKESIQEIVKIISKTVLSQNRSILDKLLIYCSSLEDLAEKIEYFDYSLGPDAEDGKLFQRVRFALASDPSQQKIYRSLVMQKEKEVKDLLEKGKEAILGLIKIFKEILILPGKNIQIQLANHYLIKGKVVTLREAIKGKADIIADFKRLYDMTITLEKG